MNPVSGGVPCGLLFLSLGNLTSVCHTDTSTEAPSRSAGFLHEMHVMALSLSLIVLLLLQFYSFCRNDGDIICNGDNRKATVSRSNINKLRTTRISLLETRGPKSIAMWPGRSSWMLDAKKTPFRHWMVGYQSVSSLSDGGRRRQSRAINRGRWKFFKVGHATRIFSTEETD